MGWDANPKFAALASFAKKRSHCFFHHHVSKPPRPLQKNFADTEISSAAKFFLQRKAATQNALPSNCAANFAPDADTFPGSANCTDRLNAFVICSCKKGRARYRKIFDSVCCCLENG